MLGTISMNSEEELYLGTAESEHVEMYLKAIWHMRERKEEVKVSSIAKNLNVRQPSVVQMLHKLNGINLVDPDPPVLSEDGWLCTLSFSSFRATPSSPFSGAR